MNDTLLSIEGTSAEDKNTTLVGEIGYCECWESPRAWDNMTRMFFDMRSYTLPKEVDNPEEYSQLGLEELEARIKEDYNVRAIWIVSAYVHGNIALQFNRRSNGFDSGIIGYMFVTEEKIKESKREYSEEELEEFARGELDTYQKYLNGEVYEYCISEYSTIEKDGKVYTSDSEVLSSCSGYYSIEEAREAMLEEYPELDHGEEE